MCQPTSTACECKGNVSLMTCATTLNWLYVGDAMVRYSKYKAADIIKALKAGERPHAGPPGENVESESGEYGNFGDADFSSVYANQAASKPAQSLPPVSRTGGPGDAAARAGPGNRTSSNASVVPPVPAPVARPMPPPVMPQVQIGVQKILTMMAPDSMTVMDLKSDLASRAGIDPNRFDVLFDNRPLHNTLTLAACGVHNGATMICSASDGRLAQLSRALAAPAGEVLTLFVAMGAPIVISVAADMSTTVGAVKMDVYGQSGVSPSDQVLTFQGLELVDELSLGDFDIPPGAMLCLMWDPPVALPPPKRASSGGGHDGGGFAAQISGAAESNVPSLVAGPAVPPPAAAAAPPRPAPAAASRPPNVGLGGAPAPAARPAPISRSKSPIERPTRSPTVSGISVDTQKVFDAQKLSS